MSAEPARILVADDDPDLRDILRSILEPAGFAVSESIDGESAVSFDHAADGRLAVSAVQAP